jgi:hypothetical protein
MRVVPVAAEIEATHQLVLSEPCKILRDWCKSTLNLPPETMVVYLPSDVQSSKFADKIRAQFDGEKMVTKRLVASLFSAVRHNVNSIGFSI